LNIKCNYANQTLFSSFFSTKVKNTSLTSTYFWRASDFFYSTPYDLRLPLYKGVFLSSERVANVDDGSSVIHFSSTKPREEENCKDISKVYQQNSKSYILRCSTIFHKKIHYIQNFTTISWRQLIKDICQRLHVFVPYFLPCLSPKENWYLIEK